MFTGIVQEIGTIRQIDSSGQVFRLHLGCTFSALTLGESIAVDGVCLTVAHCTAEGWAADATAETLARTTLGARRAGDRVHLERALRPIDGMGGHYVTGHVDAVGKVALVDKRSDGRFVAIRVPVALAGFIAEKGSVAVDGVSLTINGVTDLSDACQFDLMLIPHTLEQTTLGRRGAGEAVNIEVDILARYAARLAIAPTAPGADSRSNARILAVLERQGYMRGHGA